MDDDDPFGTDRRAAMTAPGLLLSEAEIASATAANDRLRKMGGQMGADVASIVDDLLSHARAQAAEIERHKGRLLSCARVQAAEIKRLRRVAEAAKPFAKPRAIDAPLKIEIELREALAALPEENAACISCGGDGLYLKPGTPGRAGGWDCPRCRGSGKEPVWNRKE